MSTPNPCDPKKLAICYRWLNLAPAAERRYGFAYVGWLAGGAVGLAPEKGRCSKRRANEVKLAIDAMKLWEREVPHKVTAQSGR